jgi:predicted transcriptional regulator
MKRKLLIVVSSLLVIMGGVTLVNSLSVGQVAPNLTLKNGDNTSTIPGYGTKVLTVIYATVKGSDFCDPISNALKAKGFPKAKYEGVGIANMKDSSGVPDFVIEKSVKKKRAQFGAVVLTDADGLTSQTWGLGDCKGKSVLVVLGADKKVKFVKAYSGKAPQGDVDAVVALVEGLVK